MRDYDLTTGRYVEADPLGLVDGASVYGYVGQNPGRFSDRTGLLEDLVLTLNPSKELNTLQCSCGSDFQVFSGNGEFRNDPTAQSIPSDGPIPRGSYYIVNRPSGGRNPLNRIWAWYRGKDDWFALYAMDNIIDDYTTLPDGQVRGNFRLHPGTYSLGCVTFEQESGQFEVIRQILLNTEVAKIPGTEITYYGTLSVK